MLDIKKKNPFNFLIYLQILDPEEKKLLYLYIAILYVY